MAQDDEQSAIKAVFSAPKAPDPPEPPSGDGLVRLKGISPRAYEHPADRAALTALRKLPGFDQLLRKVLGFATERSLRLAHLGGAVRVSERQFKRVHAAWRTCCEILDLEKHPELYVAQFPLVNAGALGVDEPFVVINSGTLDLLDDDELRFVLGHELGHVLSGHALYRTLLAVLLRMTLFRLGPAVAGMAAWGAILALREWSRKSELSCDRAGLLCLQDPSAAYRVHMKMAGGRRVDEMDVDAFRAQAAEYEAAGDLRDGVLKLMHMLERTHPLTVVRLAELERWVESGGYGKVLLGDYPRRTADDRASVYEEFKASAQAYKDSLARSTDPLAKFFQGFGQTVTEAGSALFDGVRDLFARKEDKPD